MKNLFVIILVGVIQNFCVAQEIIEFYSVNNNILNYNSFNINSRELNSKEIHSTSGLFFAEEISSQNNFLILSEYLGKTQKNYIFYRDKLLIIHNESISESQRSTINLKNSVVLETQNNNEIDISKVFDSMIMYDLSKHKTHILLNKTEITQSQCLDSGKIVYSRIETLPYKNNEEWRIDLKLIDLKSELVDSFYSINQTNFGDHDGYYLGHSYFWKNENEITFLLYREQDNDKKIKDIEIKLMSYRTDNKDLKIESTFSIPTYGNTIHITYLIKGDIIYFSNSDRIYEIKETQIKELLKIENNEILGFLN